MSAEVHRLLVGTKCISYFFIVFFTELIDGELDEEILAAIDSKTKPLGSLGRLEQLAFQIARIQKKTRPSAQSCQLTIFAADHGIALQGVSAYPQQVTRQMVENFLSGGAASSVMSYSVGVELRVVDAGVKGSIVRNPRLLDARTSNS